MPCQVCCTYSTAQHLQQCVACAEGQGVCLACLQCPCGVSAVEGAVHRSEGVLWCVLHGIALHGGHADAAGCAVLVGGILSQISHGAVNLCSDFDD